MPNIQKIIQNQLRNPELYRKHLEISENYKHDPKIVGQQIKLALNALENLFTQFANENPAPLKSLTEKGEYPISRLFSKDGLYHVAAILSGEQVNGEPLVKGFESYLQPQRNKDLAANNINYVILNGSIDKGFVNSFSVPLLQVATKMTYEFFKVMEANHGNITIPNSSLTALTILPQIYHDLKEPYYGKGGLIRHPEDVKYDIVNLDKHKIAKIYVEAAEQDIASIAKFLQEKAALNIPTSNKVTLAKSVQQLAEQSQVASK